MTTVVSTEELDKQLGELFHRRSMDAFLPWLQQAAVHMFESDSKERKVLTEWGLVALRVFLTQNQITHTIVCDLQLVAVDFHPPCGRGYRVTLSPSCFTVKAIQASSRAATLIL